jgi:outer membrane protein insertion porin family
MRRLLLIGMLGCWLSLKVVAAEPFRVEDVRVEGVQRVPVGTVLNYLPIRPGETAEEDRIAEAIRSLYKTGFFQDVRIGRDGQVLVVEVVERPSIASIDVRGNKAIPSEDLLKSLADIGFAEGRVFNRFVLSDVERELRRLYQSRGQYDTRVASTVSPLPRNRVGVRIDIDESAPARIREITFVGNQRFSDSRLGRLFELGPKRWYHVFSSRDQYARERLAADLERLQSFYQNQGYVNFAVTSTQVSITPDRQGIYITVNLDEGERYRIGDIELAGDLVVGAEELRGLITTQAGETYTRQEISETVRRIRDRLGAEGYAFANVNVVPELDEDRHIVDLTYFVDPGKRVLVRRINVLGNERTRDDVVRRELRQMEGAWLSTAALQRSRQRLQRLGFFEDVRIETPQVPGEADQVDVEVTVKERMSGSLQAGIGYGQSQGVMFNASVQQDNVLGTGDRLSATFNNSDINTIYSISYLDRYYTLSGISRSLNASYKSTDAADANLADYDTTTLDLGVGYTVPLNEEDSIQFGLAFERLELTLGSDATQRLEDFVAANGDVFDAAKGTVGWVRDSRNRAIFPTSGGRQRVSGELTLPGSDLEYYKIHYSHRRYWPLTRRLTFSLDLGLGYGAGYGGSDELPFFENFYAGGISSVRGYRGNSLGPRDQGDPIGGNARLVGSAELIFPPPLLDTDALRMFAFVDAGNVFDTRDQVDLGDLRYSAGVALTWMSPLGALTLSLAEPLNDRAEDRTQSFQFSIGAFF